MARRGIATLSRVHFVASALPLLGLAPFIFYLGEHGCHVRRRRVAREAAGQHAVVLSVLR